MNKWKVLVCNYFMVLSIPYFEVVLSQVEMADHPDPKLLNPDELNFPCHLILCRIQSKRSFSFFLF
jgi:hypothetical protein